MSFTLLRIVASKVNHFHKTKPAFIYIIHAELVLSKQKFIPDFKNLNVA